MITMTKRKPLRISLRLLQLDFGDGYKVRTSLTSFLTANREDEPICRKVKRLAKGDMFSVGGGASVRVKITRIK